MRFRPKAILLAPLVAGVVIAGCGADEVVDDEKTEIALRFDIGEATGTEVESVTCPADVPVSPGTRFDCLVVAASGEEAVASLEVTNDQADLKVLGLDSP